MFFVLLSSRQSSQKSTWPPTLTRDAWWTCRSTKVAPKWSGKTPEDDEGAQCFDALAHAICTVPQWAHTKAPVLFSRWQWAWLCIFNIAYTQRNRGCKVRVPWKNKRTEKYEKTLPFLSFFYGLWAYKPSFQSKIHGLVDAFSLLYTFFSLFSPNICACLCLCCFKMEKILMKLSWNVINSRYKIYASLLLYLALQLY